MILSKDNYRIMVFEPKHVDETARLLAKSFTTLNPLWNAFGIDQETAYKILRGKIHCCAIYPYSYVLVDETDKILGCAVQSDFSILQKQRQANVDLDYKQNEEMFRFLDSIEDDLQGDIWRQPAVPGDTIYCLYAATVPELANKRIASYLFHAAFVTGRVTGIKDYYTRITNPVTQKMLLGLGGTLERKIIVNLPERGIKDFAVCLIKIKLGEFRAQRALL